MVTLPVMASIAGITRLIWRKVVFETVFWIDCKSAVSM